jgi:hypothetical protein
MGRCEIQIDIPQRSRATIMPQEHFSIPADAHIHF